MLIEEMVSAADALGEMLSAAFVVAEDLSDTPLLLIRDYCMHIAEDLDPEGIEYLKGQYRNLEDSPARYSDLTQDSV